MHVCWQYWLYFLHNLDFFFFDQSTFRVIKRLGEDMVIMLFFSESSQKRLCNVHVSPIFGYLFLFPSKEVVITVPPKLMGPSTAKKRKKYFGSFSYLPSFTIGLYCDRAECVPPIGASGSTLCMQYMYIIHCSAAAPLCFHTVLKEGLVLDFCMMCLGFGRVYVCNYRGVVV